MSFDTCCCNADHVVSDKCHSGLCRLGEMAWRIISLRHSPCLYDTRCWSTLQVQMYSQVVCIFNVEVYLYASELWYFYPGVFQPSWCRPPARLSWLNLNFETGRLFVLLDGRKDKQLILYALLRMIKTTLNRGKVILLWALICLIS